MYNFWQCSKCVMQYIYYNDAKITINPKEKTTQLILNAWYLNHPGEIKSQV